MLTKNTLKGIHSKSFTRSCIAWFFFCSANYFSNTQHFKTVAAQSLLPLNVPKSFVRLFNSDLHCSDVLRYFHGIESHAFPPYSKRKKSFPAPGQRLIHCGWHFHVFSSLNTLILTSLNQGLINIHLSYPYKPHFQLFNLPLISYPKLLLQFRQ